MNTHAARTTRIDPIVPGREAVSIVRDRLADGTRAVAVLCAVLTLALPGHATAAPLIGNVLSSSEQPMTARTGVTSPSSATARLVVELRVAPSCEIALRAPGDGEATARLVCSPTSTAWMANATPGNAASGAFVPFEPRGPDDVVRSLRSPKWLRRDSVFQLDY